MDGAACGRHDGDMTSLPPEFFRRQDETPDAEFYASRRGDTHLDADNDAVVTGWYDARLPGTGAVLDVFAGARSHLPGRCLDAVGVGVDGAALERNGQLRVRHVLDLNARPELPFADRSLGGAVCTAAIQYVTRPVELVREVARCLAPGAPFLVAFSNRMFAAKAVLCWRASDDDAHVRLVRGYLAAAGGFGAVETVAHHVEGHDPLYLIAARADPDVAPG